MAAAISNCEEDQVSKAKTVFPVYLQDGIGNNSL